MVSSLGIDFMSLKMGLYGMISLPARDTPFVLHLCLVIFYVKLQQAAVHPIFSFGPFFGFLVTTNHIVFCIMVFFHFSKQFLGDIEPQDVFSSKYNIEIISAHLQSNVVS